MFYERNPVEMLRFGDVLTGSILVESILDKLEAQAEYRVGVTVPSHCVILSPCCSIDNGIITLSPLILIPGSFHDNPFLREDFTRMNREMMPEQSVSPVQWNAFPPEEKSRRLAVGFKYAFVNLFVYEGHELFPRYTPRNRGGVAPETNYYMVDFARLHSIRCDKIKRGSHPLETKRLQLTVEARQELRNKIAEYFTRVPQEDRVLED